MQHPAAAFRRLEGEGALDGEGDAVGNEDLLARVGRRVARRQCRVARDVDRRRFPLRRAVVWPCAVKERDAEDGIRVGSVVGVAVPLTTRRLAGAGLNRV